MAKTDIWASLVLDAAEELSKKDLNGSDFQIMLFLFSKADRNNKVLINQVSLSQILNISISTVSRGVNNLVNEKIIVRIPSGFMINPEIFYSGHSYKVLDNLKSEFKELQSKKDKQI